MWWKKRFVSPMLGSALALLKRVSPKKKTQTQNSAFQHYPKAQLLEQFWTFSLLLEEIKQSIKRKDIIPVTSQSCTSLLKTYKKGHTQRIKLSLLQGIGEAINRPPFFFLDRYNPRSWILPLSSFLLQIVLIYNWKFLGSDSSQNFDLGGAHGHTFINKKKIQKQPKITQNNNN